MRVIKSSKVQSEILKFGGVYQVKVQVAKVKFILILNTFLHQTMHLKRKTYEDIFVNMSTPKLIIFQKSYQMVRLGLNKNLEPEKAHERHVQESPSNLVGFEFEN